MTTDIVEKKEMSIEQIIQTAVVQGTSVETMERLLAMRDKLKAEKALEAYSKAMAAFQGECPTIVKTKSVSTSGGQIAYSYAPIESIVEQVKHLIHANGLSYAIKIETKTNGETTVKATCIVRHVDGHSEQTEMEVPLGTKTNIMSDSQRVAAASTFAKRYAFCNAFGIMTGDEDNELKLKEKEFRQEALAEYEAKLLATNSLEELKKVYANLPAVAKKELLKVKDSLKERYDNQNIQQ